LALVGDTATAMQTWVQEALDGKHTLTDLYVLDDQDRKILLGQGYETSRVCSAQSEGESVTWTERIFVVHSCSYAEVLERGLEQRLATATAKLQALTPPRGRGKRQITQEAQLSEAAEAILQAHRVEGLLTYTFERQEEQLVKGVGRGRGPADRPKRVIERVRYQITAITRQEAAITTLKQTFGWRAYATNAPAEKLTLETAVLTYRDEWLVERGFHRLKGAPLSLDPLFVKRDDQVVGRALKQAQATLVGLYQQNPKKATATPTTERLLQAFSNITLTIIHFPDRILHHVTPLTALQVQILELLGLSPDIYRSLAENST
jgi:transposase